MHCVSQVTDRNSDSELQGHFCYPDGESLGTFPFKAAENWKDFWHIDGLPTPESGVPEGQVHNFTILVGVLLNDLPGTHCVKL